MKSINCRCFCKQNLRITSLLKHLTKIFKKPQSISERVLYVGVAVVKIPGKSKVILLTKLEHDLPVHWRWVKDEKEGIVEQQQP